MYKIITCLFFIVGFVVQAQSQTTVFVLDDFTGKWKADLNKSYSSRSEREKVAFYNAEINLSGGALTIYWDYTISKRNSHYSESLIIDGKEHDLAQAFNEWDARAQKVSFDGKKITRRFNYRTSGQNVGLFLDKQIFSLSSDKKCLTIESIFRSARPFDQLSSETKKLVLCKE